MSPRDDGVLRPRHTHLRRMAPHPRHWIVRTGRSGQLRRHGFGPARAREHESFNISYVLITLPIAAAVIFATVTKRDGESLAAITLRRMRWTKGKLAGYQALRAGTIVEELGAWDLPGPLAAHAAHQRPRQPRRQLRPRLGPAHRLPLGHPQVRGAVDVAGRRQRRRRLGRQLGTPGWPAWATNR